MVARARRVLVSEHEEDLGELLRIVLEDEGYEVRVFVEEPDSSGAGAALLDLVGDFDPDLLVIDLLPTGGESSQTVLDHLRTDPASAQIPLLVVSTAEALTESATASYNVREVLTKPFALADFLQKVSMALDQPIITPPPPQHPSPEQGVFAVAQSVLAARAREAIFRWVQRLQAEPPWRGRRDLRLPSLIDSVPLLVEAITAAIGYQSADELFRRSPEVLEKARHHALLRMEQGLPLESAIKEYILLRNELWEILSRELAGDFSSDDIAVLEEIVNRTVERVSETTTATFRSSGGPSIH